MEQVARALFERNAGDYAEPAMLELAWVDEGSAATGGTRRRPCAPISRTWPATAASGPARTCHDGSVTTPTDTRITLSHVMKTGDANLLGTVHGGNIMKMVDDTAGVAANRFAQGPAVTAAMDEMAFHNPVRVGDVLHVSAQVNWAGRTSMEVGVRAQVDRRDAVNERVHAA